MSRLREMEMFVNVVEAGSFTGAAGRLDLTPSAVSKQVSRLEERLDTQLLNRTTRRLSLTDEGEAFFQRSRTILAEIEDAERVVARMHDTPRGNLRVNAASGPVHHLLMPVMPEFLARYPEVRLQLTLTNTMVDLVEERVDVAIRVGTLADSSMIARRIMPRDRVVAASPGYLARHGEPRNPADLAGHNCLIFNYYERPEEWAFVGPDGPETVTVSGNFESNSGHALENAAVAGIGVIRISRFVVQPALESGRLVSLLAGYEDPSPAAIYAVYPHTRHLSPRVRVFVDYLVETLGEGGS